MNRAVRCAGLCVYMCVFTHTRVYIYGYTIYIYGYTNTELSTDTLVDNLGASYMAKLKLNNSHYRSI